MGETGVISATVQPLGTPVSWTTNDSGIATVEDGNVSAIAEGIATITGTITVEGVEYSDTVSVEVSIPDWETVWEFTSRRIWNNETRWLQQFYVDDTRRTYCYHSGQDLVIVYNGANPSTSIYVDIRAAMVNPDTWYDPAYDYAMRIRCDIPNPDWAVDVVMTRHEANYLISDGNNYPITGMEPETLIPLEARTDPTLQRLFTLQIKANTPPNVTEAEAGTVIELVKKRKV